MSRGDRSVVQIKIVLIFRSWDFHVNYSVWDAFNYIFSKIYNFYGMGKLWINQTLRLSLKYFMENSHIVMNINSFGPLNTTLKYYRKQAALKKKLKVMGEAMIFFTKMLLGHKIFSSMVPWAMKEFLKNL